MSNFISNDINPQSFQEIVAMLQSIKDKMPYLAEIDSASQLLLPKLKDEQVPFVEKCLKHAQNVPAIAPTYIEIEEFEKALALYEELHKILKSLNSLSEKIENTIAVSGSDAYVAAIAIFKNVRKNADNEEIPQIRSMLFDLNKAFEDLGNAKPQFV